MAAGRRFPGLKPWRVLNAQAKEALKPNRSVAISQGLKPAFNPWILYTTQKSGGHFENIAPMTIRKY
jgi:hypothetical protein